MKTTNPFRACLLLLGLLSGFLTPVSLKAQVGGRTVYDFLHMSPTARTTALGGVIVSQQETDPGLAFQNPASLSDSTHSLAQVAYINYLADIGYGTFAYAHTEPGVAHFFGGFQYFSFGKFEETDIVGNQLGDFSVNQLQGVVGAAKSYGPVTLGMNFKFVQASIYRQTSWGLATDYGAQYQNKKWGFGAGIALRNLGLVMNRLPGQDASDGFPFTIDIGISQQLPKAPLRFSVTATQLNRPRMVYTDPTAPVRFDLAGNPIEEETGTGENILRHMIFGMEIIPGPGFNIRASYNHRRRQELHPSDLGFNFDGFAVGIGLRIKMIYLDYAYGGYHVAGGLHHFQLTVPMQRVVKKSIIRRQDATTPAQVVE